MGGQFRIDGKIALVTGSSRGLGFTLAQGLARAGAKVVLNARTQTRLREAEQRLKEHQFKAYSYCFDVTDKSLLADLIPRIEQEVGPIDILVNNAGINKRGPLQELEEAVWREVLDTNLTGVFLCSQQVAKSMITRKRGKIINICSLMSEVTRPTTGAYSASKGGVKMLTKAMALEWAQHNIQVNGIGPGYFITEMTQPLADDPEFDAWICKRTPAARWGDPEELVGPLIFLASDASSFVNGHVLYVDGGVLTAL